MTKEEIKKRIFELQTDEEIIEFVNERLKELEDNSVERTVGQGYTDSFQDYISEKTHYKAVGGIKDCPDLVYDDITPYVSLIKKIRDFGSYNELNLFTIIVTIIHSYLPLEDESERYFTYVSHKGKKLSIKTIREDKVAMCSERTGLAHNMLKFLGTGSEVVCGSRDDEFHAYNLVYPLGYGSKPAILYDASFFVKFYKVGHEHLYGFYKRLTDEEYETLLSGLPVWLELSNTEKWTRVLYGSDGSLDDYSFDYETPTYVFGLENAKKHKESNASSASTSSR